MKLATYQDGSRDGQLIVVSRDLSQAHYATGIASRLQAVLDDWNFLSPQLQDLYDQLNSGRARHAFAFDPAHCLAPLPRAYQWVQASAYLPALERQHQAHAGQPPARWKTQVQLQQGCGDSFSGACADILLPSANAALDFGAQLAAISGDVRRGSTPEQALEGVRLLMLANQLTLPDIHAAETALGSGAVRSQPGTAFSPLACTPDEFGDAWRAGRLHLTLHCSINGRKVGLCDAGADMQFHFGQLLAQLASTRHVRAGSIIGSGALSNQDASKGYCRIADKRLLEQLQDGQARTPFLQDGDSLLLEMRNHLGQPVFGSIHQNITAANAG